MDPYGFQMDKLRKVFNDPQRLNGYLYSRGNPIVLVDPDGNEGIFFTIPWGL